MIINILLRFYPKYNLDIYHSVMINYFICAILSFFILTHNFYIYQSHDIPWNIILPLGILMPTIFVLMSKSINKIGLIKTDTVQRISLIIDIIFSFTFFNEKITLPKLIGIIIAIIAMLLVIYNKNYDFKKNNFNDYTLLLIIWAGFGLIDILFKLLTQKNLFYPYLTLIFFTAFIFMLIFNTTLYKRKLLLKNTLIGIILGILNFFTAFFYIKSHKIFQDSPSIVFTNVSIGVIVISTIIGALVFKEKINKNNYYGIFLSICSIIILFVL